MLAVRVALALVEPLPNVCRAYRTSNEGPAAEDGPQRSEGGTATHWRSGGPCSIALQSSERVLIGARCNFEVKNSGKFDQACSETPRFGEIPPLLRLCARVLEVQIFARHLRYFNYWFATCSKRFSRNKGALVFLPLRPESIFSISSKSQLKSTNIYRAYGVLIQFCGFPKVVERSSLA